MRRVIPHETKKPNQETRNKNHEVIQPTNLGASDYSSETHNEPTLSDPARLETHNEPRHTEPTLNEDGPLEC